MQELILLIITIAWLIIASITDIKTREIPDWISYSLISLAIITRIISSIQIQSFQPILLTLLGLAIGISLSLSLYYTKQWGGGDAKIFMALSSIFIISPAYFNPLINMPFLAILLINIILVAVIYSLSYIIFTAVKNKNKVLEEIKNYKLKKIKIAAILISIILLLMAFKFSSNTLIIAAILMLIFPYIIILTKTTEKISMIKLMPINKVTEGDWLAEDIYHNKKLIINKNHPELTLKDIEKLKRLNIKNIKIKYGIPFAPTFLVAVIISLTLGNIIFMVI